MQFHAGADRAFVKTNFQRSEIFEIRLRGPACGGDGVWVPLGHCLRTNDYRGPTVF
jgi:hypothetical protein